MDPTMGTSIVYGLVSVGLTVGLARILNRHGRVFLRQLFPENVETADATNTLLVIGFFMLNLGFALMGGEMDPVRSAGAAIEQLTYKIGFLLFCLGVMHFLNMAVFWKIRRSMSRSTGAVPVPFTTMVPPPPTGEPVGV